MVNGLEGQKSSIKPQPLRDLLRSRAGESRVVFWPVVEAINDVNEPSWIDQYVCPEGQAGGIGTSPEETHVEEVGIGSGTDAVVEFRAGDDDEVPDVFGELGEPG